MQHVRTESIIWGAWLPYATPNHLELASMHAQEQKENVKDSSEGDGGVVVWWRYRWDDKEFAAHEVEKTHGAGAVGEG